MNDLDRMMTDRSTAAAEVSSAFGRLTLSVVVCTRDRPRALEACVRSVMSQAVLPCEVIVVDDGELSEQDRKMLASMCEAKEVPFVYLKKEPSRRFPCLPASRNLAVRHARGDIVQFLDDDVTLDPQFLGEILRLYTDDFEGCLIGTDGVLHEPHQVGLGARVFDWLFRVAGWWALEPRHRGRPRQPACVRDPCRATPTLKIVGATMAFRQGVLRDDPFDEAMTDYALGEDRDAAYRLSRYGWIARCRTARATHHHDPLHRPDPYRFGRMTVQNYCRIMAKHGLNRMGDWLVHLYSLLVIALGLVCFSLVRPKPYWPRLGGMVIGGAIFMLEQFVWTRSPRGTNVSHGVDMRG